MMPDPKGQTVNPLPDQIAEVLNRHVSKQVADTTSRPGFRIWRDGCSGCDWLGENHAAHAAEQVTDLLLDLAGTGQLLASIDRIAR